MEIASNNTFSTIFPKYAQLAEAPKFSTNQAIENYIKNDLPLQVDVVRKLQGTLNVFLTQYSNLIIKRPQVSNLAYSLAGRATDLLDKHMKEYETKCQKMNKQSINSLFSAVHPRRVIELFKTRLAEMEPVIRQKYISNSYIKREHQQKIAAVLYSLMQIYHFSKSDLVTIASKYQLKDGQIISQAFRNASADIGSLPEMMGLDQNFTEYIDSIVQKRCRPFYNKRDYFNGKIREVLREAQSRSEPNIAVLIESLLSKQKHRLVKLVIPKVQGILKNISEVPEQAGCKQISDQVEALKRKFMVLKNNSFYIDIIRGNFSEKYKMEINKLENLYYLNSLEKYLQDAMQFVEQLLKIQEEIINNRKSFKKTLVEKVENELYQIQNTTSSQNLKMLDEQVNILFDNLEQLLQSVDVPVEGEKRGGTLNNIQGYSQKQTYQKAHYSQKNVRVNQEAERKKLREQERARKVQEEIELRKARDEERKKLQQYRKAKQLEQAQKRKAKLAQQKLERQQKDQLKRQKQDEQKKKRADEMLKKQQEIDQKKKIQQQKRRNDEKLRKQIEEKRKRDEEQKQNKLQQQKVKKQEQRRKRQQQQARIKKQADDKKKKQDQQKRIMMQEKKRKQDDARRLEQQQKIKQQQQQQQIKIRDEQSKKKLAQQADKKKRQELQRQRKQQETKRAQEQQKKAKQAQLKRAKQEQAKLKAKQEAEELKRRQQQQERKKKQDQIRKKEEEQRKIKQQQQKKKKEQQQQKKKEQQERKRKQAEQAKRKQDEEKRQKEERQRKQIEEKKKRELEQKQKQQAQQKERKKKQQQKLAREAQTKKLKEQEQKRQKLKNEQQVKKKQEAQKRKKQEAAKQKNTKKSAINYGNLDDELIDEDQEEIKRPSPISIPNKGKKADDQYLQEYDDDFDEFSPEKQENNEEGGEIATEKLLEMDTLKCLNDYVKGTTYARKNKPNLELLNDASQYLAVFEEQIQTQKLYVYSHPSIEQVILHFVKELQDQSISEEELKSTIETIHEELEKDVVRFFGEYRIAEMTRLLFPFSSNSKSGIYQVCITPAVKQVIVVLKQDINDEETKNKIEIILNAFLNIYDVEDPEIIYALVEQNSKAVLDTFDKQIPNLLLTYALYYEQEHNFTTPVVINQYTVERFFYTAHIIQPFYKAIKQEQGLPKFYEQLNNKYFQDAKIKIFPYETEVNDPNYASNISQISRQTKEEFLSSPTAQHYLAALELVIQGEEGDEQEQEVQFRKISIYFSLSKESKGKPSLNYYIVSESQVDEQYQHRMFEWASSELDDQFETKVYTDFTRHNCLSEYSSWSIGLWAHVIQKKKMTAIQAFRTMTLAMTPYYLAYKQQD